MSTLKELSAEETLKELERDFQQYIDADNQIVIGATYDLPFRQRMVAAFKAASDYAGKLAARDEEIEELQEAEAAECTNCDDLEEEISAFKSENAGLKEQIDRLRRELVNIAKLSSKAAA